MNDERHWLCPECGAFDGPVTDGKCDVCAGEGDIVTVEPYVPASRLAEAEAEVEQLWDDIAARDAVIVRYMGRYGRLDRG